MGTILVPEAILVIQDQQYPTNMDRQKLAFPCYGVLSQRSHVVTQPYTMVVYHKVKVTKLYDTKIIQYEGYTTRLYDKVIQLGYTIK